MLSGEGLLC